MVTWFSRVSKKPASGCQGPRPDTFLAPNQALRCQEMVPDTPGIYFWDSLKKGKKGSGIVFVEELCYLQATVQSQFLHDIVHMAFHSVGGDVELQGNVFVAQTVGD
jgi:hypothetical protein